MGVDVTRRVGGLWVSMVVGVLLHAGPADADGRLHAGPGFHRGGGVHRSALGHGIASFRTHRGFLARHAVGAVPRHRVDRHAGVPREHHHGHRHHRSAPVLTSFAVPLVLAAPPAEPVPAPVAPTPVINVTQVVTVAPATPPPAIDSPAPVAASAPPVPPTPTVVEYPTGRYELRGDGLAVPYAWVWVPNVPAEPPEEAEASGDQARAGRSTVYQWTDADGTRHWTNRLDRVPAAHRPADPEPETGRS